MSSILILPVFIGVWFYYVGADWMVGAVGAILVMNLIIQVSNYFGMPRALAKRAANLAKAGVEVETTPEGFKVVSGQSANAFPWSTFTHVWMHDNFVILVLGTPLASRFMYLPTNGMTPEVHQAFEIASRGKAVA